MNLMSVCDIVIDTTVDSSNHRNFNFDVFIIVFSVSSTRECPVLLCYEIRIACKKFGSMDYSAAEFKNIS